MSLISAVQKQVVDRDKLISNEEVLDGISLASVLPGPIAVNVVSFIGYRLKGIRGAIVCFIGILIPSFLLMLLLSALYQKFGNVPEFGSFFAGVLPAVAAIIISVAVGMIKKNVSDWKQIILVVLSGVVTYFSRSYFSTLLIIVFSGLAGYFLYRTKTVGSLQSSVYSLQSAVFRRQSAVFSWQSAVGSLLILIIILLVIIPEKETLVWLHRKIMLTFSSMSLSLFGGGYVAVPSMHKIIVDTLHWLTNKEFVDAIALGQVTPGPILVSATFIGYKLAGFFGALNATLSIFLPTAILMVICSRFLAKINNAPALKAAFKGLRPAIIGMILSAAVTILVSTGISYKTIILFLAILAVVIKYNPDTVFIIPVAGVIGLILL
jgi:chromate transporter